jgi:hypothetical protein
LLAPVGQLATVADVSSIITGLTTIALVMVTYAAVRSGRASAEAAASSAELAERQLREAHRPVLVPMDAPYDQGPDLMIAVRNIGVGPALRVYGRAQTRNLPPTVVGRFALHPLAGVETGGVTELRFRAALQELLSVKIVFDDVLGKTYTTDARWDAIKKAFVYAGVVDGDTARVPVQIGVSDDQITIGVGSAPPSVTERPPGEQLGH